MKSAIIGCGRIAWIHAAALSGMENAQLIACVDTDISKAQPFAVKHNLKAYADYKDMIDKEKPDVVHLCTPHHLHVEMAIFALSLGIHVFTEKPAAINVHGFQLLIEAQNKYKAEIGVCFQNRYNASVQYVQRDLMNKHNGKILGARCIITWNRNADYYADDWHGKKATEGGGVLINQAIHSMDLLVYLLGEPSSVQASMHNHRLRGIIDVEDTVEAFIRFGSIPAHFYASNAYCIDSPIMLEIVCEHATYQISGDDLTILHTDGPTDTFSSASLTGEGEVYWGTGHKLCIADFYQSIEEKVHFSITPLDIRQTMSLVFGCYESASKGKTIQLNERKEQNEIRRDELRP